MADIVVDSKVELAKSIAGPNPFETPVSTCRSLGTQIGAIPLGGGLNHIVYAKAAIDSGKDVVFYDDYVAVHRS